MKVEGGGLRGHQIDSRSECPAPLAPFLGGEGLGVRGERSLGCGSPPYMPSRSIGK